MKFLKNVKTDEFMATVTRTVSKYGYKLKKASPTIMIFGAAIVGVAATVSACKATVKAQDILEDHNEMVKAIHETKEKVDSGEMILKEGAAYTENDYKKDLTCLLYTSVRHEGEWTIPFLPRIGFRWADL